MKGWTYEPHGVDGYCEGPCLVDETGAPFLMLMAPYGHGGESVDLIGPTLAAAEPGRLAQLEEALRGFIYDHRRFRATSAVITCECGNCQKARALLGVEDSHG